MSEVLQLGGMGSLRVQGGNRVIWLEIEPSGQVSISIGVYTEPFRSQEDALGS
jgi:hypothetical protein